MEIKELYLKTAFCCMACDGNIANEEIELVKSYVKDSSFFDGLEVEKVINDYIKSINANGISFLYSFIKDLRNEELSEENQLQIVKIAIEMIEADNEILYSEVKFFKKIRNCLSISDETILRECPDKKDYLLPDIIQNDYEFILETAFSEFKLHDIN